MNEEKKTLQDEVSSLVAKKTDGASTTNINKKEETINTSSQATVNVNNARNTEYPLNILHEQVEPAIAPKIVSQKSIRTYESDVAEALSRKKTSVMTMAIAENKKESGTNSISN